MPHKSCMMCFICSSHFEMVGGQGYTPLHTSFHIHLLIPIMHQPWIYLTNIFKTKTLEEWYCPHHLKDSDIWPNKPKSCLCSLSLCRNFQRFDYVLRKSRSMQKPKKYQMNIKHMLLLINTRNTYNYSKK